MQKLNQSGLAHYVAPLVVVVLVAVAGVFTLVASHANSLNNNEGGNVVLGNTSNHTPAPTPAKPKQPLPGRARVTYYGNYCARKTYGRCSFQGFGILRSPKSSAYLSVTNALGNTNPICNGVKIPTGVQNAVKVTVNDGLFSCSPAVYHFGARETSGTTDCRSIVHEADVQIKSRVTVALKLCSAGPRSNIIVTPATPLH